jgi:DNA-binding beta-propeller fold protein YncE
VSGMERQLRDLLDAAVGAPPHRVSVEAVRRRVIRRRVMECIAGAAAVAVIAVIVPVGIAAFGHTPGPPAEGSAVIPTMYVSNNNGTVTPITLATGTPGKPIKVGGSPGQIVITPDGKTAYVLALFPGTVTPIATATNTAGKPINLGSIPVRLRSRHDLRASEIMPREPREPSG